jgi:glycosyltransferase involved in cell wall biosynthesis
MTLPSYLIAVSSTCQMYSGTGTVIFDWMRFAKPDFRFEVLMDFEDPLNFEIMRDFCVANDVTLHPSPGLPLPGCADSGIRAANDHLATRHYDFIECVSWANSSTNLNVVASRRNGSRLIFVPHSQPLWTLAGHERFFMTSAAFRGTLHAADFVFVDSPWESRLDEFASVPPEKVHFVPLGVDSGVYSPGSVAPKPHHIVSVGDWRERRKRVDCLIAAFSRAHSLDRRLRLVLVGKGADEVSIPSDIASAVTRLGYVERGVLVDLYRSSQLFVLLSEYEAFGLPIAEALCCGCPVLVSGLPVLRDVFSSLPGVSFTDNTDVERTARSMCQLAGATVDRRDVARRATETFSFAATYGKKRSILLGR